MQKVLPVGTVFEIGYGNDREVILGVRSFEELARLFGSAEVRMINSDAAILAIDRSLVEYTPNEAIGGGVFSMRIDGVPLRLVRATPRDNTVEIAVDRVPANVVSEL